jgi:NADH-quinone oxidoreductase subunit L
MWRRLIFKVFFGKLRVLDVKPCGNLPHQRWRLGNISLPLIFVINLLPVPNILIESRYYTNNRGCSKAFTTADHLERMNIYHTIIPAGLNILSIVVIYFGLYAIYVRNVRCCPLPQHNFLFNFSYNEWYFNKAYNNIFVKPVLALGSGLFWFDRKVIDGFIRLLQHITYYGYLNWPMAG